MPSIFRRETLWRAAALFAPIFYWIAFLWRRMLPRTTVIAITGSLGKTTTKELLADILSSVAKRRSCGLRDFHWRHGGLWRRRAIDAGLKPEAVHAFSTLREAADFLRSDLKSGDLVLLKGRTTDHATRIFFAQLGQVKCWREYCGKRMLCDLCPQLGLSRETLRAAAAE